MAKKYPKKKKRMHTVRNENLRGHVDELMEFAGKIICFDMKNYVDGDETASFLISPLYAKIEKKWTYIDHAWVKLDISYARHRGEVFGFIGLVKTYQLGMMVGFEEQVYVGTDEQRYPELRFWNGDVNRYQPKERKRELDKNISIIRAFEFGSKLPEAADHSEVKKQEAFYKHRRRRHTTEADKSK